MKAFYIALLDYFEANQNRFTDLNLKPIKHIDFYAGQDQDPESFPNLFFPSLLFSWSINYETEPATVNLEFRIVFENLRDTSNLSQNKETALLFFDMAKLVDNLLKEMDIEELGALHLVFEGLETQPTVTDVYLLNYEANICKLKTRTRTYLEVDIEELELAGELKTKKP
jgi:hypothetical protein